MSFTLLVRSCMSSCPWLFHPYGCRQQARCCCSLCKGRRWSNDGDNDHDDCTHGRNQNICNRRNRRSTQRAQQTFDISADLEELANTPVMVVCAGAKAILDLPLTLEYLETHGVPVVGYGTKELPAFYTRRSGLEVDYRLDSPEEIADMLNVQGEFGAQEWHFGDKPDS